jgi:predicted AAA+ superfamily ATPase
LLDPEVENTFSKNPERLKLQLMGLKTRPERVVIDEIQKVPKLLDVVHGLIESKLKTKFILTGSSARKLKRGAANLLAGRAYVYNLHPLTFLELGPKFNLVDVLHWGSLPRIFSLQTDRERKTFLNSYVLTYLNEEIRAEQIVRKLDPFRSFLPILGQVSGKIINHKRIADEIGTTTATVQSYFQIVEDTLLGFYLPAFHKSVRKSQKSSPKFYLFDTGVKKSLEESLDQIPVPKTSVFGELFEHFIVNEIYRYNLYYEKDFRLSFYATKNNVEIDLVLSKGRSHYLIEIKSKDVVDEAEVRSLAKTSQDFSGLKGVFYLSNDKMRMKIENVQCLYWQDFMKEFEKL